MNIKYIKWPEIRYQSGIFSSNIIQQQIVWMADQQQQENKADEGVPALPYLNDMKKIWNSMRTSFNKNECDARPLGQINDLLTVLAADTLCAVSEDQAEGVLKFGGRLMEEAQAKFLFTEMFQALTRNLPEKVAKGEPYINLVAETLQTIISLFVAELQIEENMFALDIAKAMKNVFQIKDSNKFYKEHFQKDMGALDVSEPLSKGVKLDLSAISKEELEWRCNLKEGQVIDAFKRDNKFDHACWAAGKIIKVSMGDIDDKYPYQKLVKEVIGDKDGLAKFARVEFECDGSVEAQMFRFDAEEIAPLKTKTLNDGWRYNLQKMDMVDVMDENKVWRSGTVLEPEQRKEYKFPIIKVGFRQYHDHGEKNDKLGKYDGWSSDLDVYICPFSVRVQKSGLMCKVFDLAEGIMKSETLNDPTKRTEKNDKPYKKEQQDKADMEMIQNEGDIIYATERLNCKSTALVAMVNKFGESQGYDRLLQICQRPETTLEHMQMLVSSIAGVVDLFHKSFIDWYAPQIQSMVEKKILESTKEQLKHVDVKSGLLELFDDVYDKILGRCCDQNETLIAKNKLKLKMAVIFMQQDFLQRRIDGARIINDLCSKVSVSGGQEDGTPEQQAKFKSKQMVLACIEEHQILKEFFSKQKCHNQLITRSEYLLGLLIDQNKISEEQYEMIWKSVTEHNEKLQEFYKVLKDIAVNMSPNTLYFFITRIAETPIEQLSGQDIELLQALAVKSGGDSSPETQRNNQFVLKVIWDYLFYDVINRKIEKRPSFEIKHAFKATYVFAEIMKSADQQLVANLIKLNEETISSAKGLLCGIWNKEVLSVPDFSEGLEEEAPEEESSKEELQRFMNSSMNLAANKQNVSDACFYSIKILRNFLIAIHGQVKTMRAGGNKKEDISALSTLCDDWLGSGLPNLSTLIINDLESYMGRIKSQVKIEIFSAFKAKRDTKFGAMTEQELSGMFKHSDQLKERLDLLKYIADISDVEISKEQLCQLWKIIITNNEHLVSDHKIFYLWLNQISRDVIDVELEQRIISVDNLVEFFGEVCSDESAYMHYDTLSVEGYACVQGFFTLVNQRMRRLIVLGDETDETVKKNLSLKLSKTGSAQAVPITDTAQPAKKEGDEKDVKADEIKDSKGNAIPASQVAAFHGGSADQKKEDKSNVTSIGSDGTKSYNQYSWNKNNRNTTSTATGPGTSTVAKPPAATEQALTTTWAKAGAPASVPQVELLVRVEPNEMANINMLWKIALDCQSTAVNEHVVNLLLSLYTNVDFGMEHLIPTFEDQFIDKCCKIIDEQLSLIEKRTPEVQTRLTEALYEAYGVGTVDASRVKKVLHPEELRIMRVLGYLKMLVHHSERDGTNGLRPHSSLINSTKLVGLKIVNSVNAYNHTEFKKKVEVDVDSGLTLFEFKKVIINQLWDTAKPKEGETLPLKKHCTKLTVSKTGKVLKDADNGKTLAELQFRAGENFICSLKSDVIVSKVPLFNDEKTDINERAKYIFTTMFKDFAKTDPEDNTLLIMEREEVRNFIMIVTQCKSVDHDDGRIDKIIEHGKQKEGKLLLEEFISFYRKNCFSAVETVRSNLLKYNYRNDLRQSAQDGDDDNVMQTRKTREEMPRDKLTNNPQYFNTFTKLMTYTPVLKDQAIALVETCCTRPTLCAVCLHLDKGDRASFDWEEIFDKSNDYRLLYALQVIYSMIIETPTQKGEEPTQEEALKKNWIERFLLTGGFDYLLHLFYSLMDHPFPQGNDLNSNSKNQLQQACLKLLKRILEIFLTAAFYSVDPHYQKKIEESQKVEEKDTSDFQGAFDGNKAKTSWAKPNETVIPFANAAGITGFIGPTPPSSTVAKSSVSMATATDDGITQETLFGEPAAATEVEKDAILGDAVKVEEVKAAEPVKTTFYQQMRFVEIVKVMEMTKQGEKLVRTFDFEALQECLLNLLSQVLQKTKCDSEVERDFVKSTMSLWKTIIIAKPDLLQKFYAWKRIMPQEQEEQKVELTQEQKDVELAKEIDNKEKGKIGHKITDAKSLCIAGIFATNLFNREAVQQTFEEVIKKIKNCSAERPLFFFLKLLTENFPKPSQRTGIDKFFSLYESCIRLIKDERATASEEELEELNAQLDIYNILFDNIQRLKENESIEKQTSTYTKDILLLNLLKIVKLLFAMYKTTVPYEQLLLFFKSTELIHEIFYEQLYYIPGKTQNPKQTVKCWSTDSRAAAYDFLIRVLKTLEPKDLNEFLSGSLLPMVESLDAPIKWRHEPSGKNRVPGYQIGINNPGCLCYAIAMFQQFFMVPQFRYNILKAMNHEPENMQEYKERMVNDNMLYQFQKMFGFLELSDRGSYDPKDFAFSFKDYDGNPTNTGQQQDAQEFLNTFFDRLENKLEDTSQKYLVDDVFKGHQVSQLVCTECGFAKNKPDSFFALTLEVKNRHTVHESLRASHEGSLINDYDCQGCKKRVDVKERKLLTKTPNVLILHLQRIMFSFESFKNIKVNSQLDIPNVLDLRPYTFKNSYEGEDISMMEDETGTINFKDLMEQDDDLYIYRLVGVVIHRGNADHGHYWSLINKTRGADEPDPFEKEAEWKKIEGAMQWRKFDDDTVSSFMFSEVKGEAFGGDAASSTVAEESAFIQDSGSNYGKSAYMLVYERKKKTPLRSVTNSKDEELKVKLNAVEKEDASKKEEAAAGKGLPEEEQKPEEPNAEKIPQAAEKKEEVIAEIDYTVVDKYVPQWISDDVKKDNIAFVIDRQIFNEHFFTLIKMILEHISKDLIGNQTCNEPEYVEQLRNTKLLALNIGRKTIFDFLSHYAKNSLFSNLSESICKILESTDSPDSFLENDTSAVELFIRQTFMNDHMQYFFKLMFKCTDQTSRYYAAKVSSSYLVQAFSIIQNNDRSQEKVAALYDSTSEILTQSFLKLQDRETQKDWSRLLNYFTFLSAVVSAGPVQTKILLEKQESLIIDLCDFILQKDSPKAGDEIEKRVQMGGAINKAQFGPLFSIISHLVRSKYTTAMLDLTEDQLPITCLTFEQEKHTFRLDVKLEVTQEEIDWITNPELLKLVFHNGYNQEDFGKALAHVCYGNEKVSKKVARNLIKGLNSLQEQAKINYLLDIIKEFCGQNESPDGPYADLPGKRLEWIFGFGTLKSTENGDHIVFGLESTFHEINKDVFTFQSSVTYKPEVDTSLLTLLWRYQSRPEDFESGLSFLKSLIKIICQNERIIAFFSELPGLTYQWARYTDWIRPYLERVIQRCTGFKESSAKDTQRDEAVKTLSEFEIYENYIDRIDGFKRNRALPETMSNVGDQILAGAPSVKMIDSKVEILENYMDDHVKDEKEMEKISLEVQELAKEPEKPIIKVEEEKVRPVIVCKPAPYVIMQGITKTECPVLCEEKDGILLTVTAVDCAYIWSQPTGDTNKAIPDNYYSKYIRKFDKGQKTAFEMQKAGATGEMKSSGLKSKLYASVGRPIEQPALVVKDDNDQWEKVNEEDGYNCDNEDNELMQKQENEMMQSEDPIGSKGAAPESKAEVDDSEVSALSRTISVPGADGLNESFSEKEWDVEKHIGQQTVYKVSVQNALEIPVLVKINFTRNFQDEINIKYPKTGFVGHLDGGKSCLIGLLSKIDPSLDDNPIEKLNFEIKMKHDVERIASLGPKDLPAQKPTEEAVKETQRETAPIHQDFAFEAAVGGEKSCGACTFVNDASATVCDICQTPF